jgi:hypothetical protein
VLCDGHELHTRETKAQNVLKLPFGSLESALRGEGADMQLIDEVGIKIRNSPVLPDPQPGINGDTPGRAEVTFQGIRVAPIYCVAVGGLDDNSIPKSRPQISVGNVSCEIITLAR